jgi:hypothetical protein
MEKYCHKKPPGKRFVVIIGYSFFTTIIFITILLSGCKLLLSYSLGAYDKDYSVTELKSNFNLKEKEILELKKYFQSIVPRNRYVEIEFKNDRILERLCIATLDSTQVNPKRSLRIPQKGDYHTFYDLKINAMITDSLIKPFGWSRATLKILKQKLDNANCISIESSEPAKIGFRRCGMGMYFFNVYDNPISENERKEFNDSCSYIYVNDHLVLEYGGGAIGPQCFYNMK